MTLQQIRYLETVARTGSISRAAEALYLAQSSISAAIKEVEQEYNILIFKRTSRGVTLTHQGREFLTDIRYIASYHEHIDTKYKNAGRENARFCISSHHHICGEDAFLRLAQGLARQHYRLGYLEGNTAFVLENVESGKSDIGILFFTEGAKGVVVHDMRRRGIIFHHIAYGHMHVYLHESHPLAGRDEVRLHEITRYPFVTYDNHVPNAGQYTISFQQWNQSEQIFHVSDRATAYSIIRLGQAYATGTGHRSVDERNSDIVTVPVVDLEKIELGWLALDRTALSEIAMEYVSLLREMFESGIQ